MTFKPDHYQELALKTWYSPDDPRYLDPRHPLIKLAGEAGEILDLFGKHEYKPGFDWWQCKTCKGIEDCGKLANGCKGYTPLVLDELGDYWYYLRIVAYQRQMTFDYLAAGYDKYTWRYLEYSPTAKSSRINS